MFSLSVSLALSPTTARAQTDPSSGRHFGLSAALSLTGYGLSTLVTDNSQYGLRLAAGGGFSLSLGIAKELYDSLGYGDPSWSDLAFDLAGTALGLLIAWGFDVLAHPGHAMHNPHR